MDIFTSLETEIWSVESGCLIMTQNELFTILLRSNKSWNYIASKSFKMKEENISWLANGIFLFDLYFRNSKFNKNLTVLPIIGITFRNNANLNKGLDFNNI